MLQRSISPFPLHYLSCGRLQKVKNERKILTCTCIGTVRNGLLENFGQ